MPAGWLYVVLPVRVVHTSTAPGGPAESRPPPVRAFPAPMAASGPCFALEISAAGVCVDAPPIARRQSLGRRSGEVMGYWRSCGARITAFVDP